MYDHHRLMRRQGAVRQPGYRPLSEPVKGLGQLAKAPMALAALYLALAALPAQAQQPIDLSTWEVIQYQDTEGPANWVLSDNNTVATQTRNGDPSILLGDFDIADVVIVGGSLRVQTGSDDDLIGFVFGYQDRGQFYLFDWKKADQNDPLGFAERGMTVKRVSTAKGGEPTGGDLWPTAGSPNVTPLYHNTIPWRQNVDYYYVLVFFPGAFTIEVYEGDEVLLSETFYDDTFEWGAFGIYNYSQQQVRYQVFAFEP